MAIYYLLFTLSLTANNNVPNCNWIYYSSGGAHISTSKTSLNLRDFASYKEIRLESNVKATILFVLWRNTHDSLLQKSYLKLTTLHIRFLHVFSVDILFLSCFLIHISRGCRRWKHKIEGKSHHYLCKMFRL